MLCMFIASVVLVQRVLVVTSVPQHQDNAIWGLHGLEIARQRRGASVRGLREFRGQVGPGAAGEKDEYEGGVTYGKSFYFLTIEQIFVNRETHFTLSTQP